MTPTPPGVGSPRPVPARAAWLHVTRTVARALPRATRLLAVALVLALALGGGTGCMVMDELDSAAAKMPTTDANKKKDAKAGPAGKAQTPAERLAAAKSAVSERSKQWWKEAKTMTPGEKPAGIVQCRLTDGVRFMSKDDCVVQGGRVADGAG